MRCSSVSTAGCREGEAWERDDHSVTNGLLVSSSSLGLLLARSLINDASTCLVFCDGTKAEAGQTLETRRDTATAAPAMARARWRRRLLMAMVERQKNKCSTFACCSYVRYVAGSHVLRAGSFRKVQTGGVAGSRPTRSFIFSFFRREKASESSGRRSSVWHVELLQYEP